MADRTISELDAVKESPIGGLPEVLELYDNSLLPVEQQGVAMRITGRQLRQFGEKTAELYVQTAVEAARAAEESREGAEGAKKAAAAQADRAREIADGIQLDRDALDRAVEDAQASAGQSAQSASAAEDWSNTSKSWAVGEGLGEKRPDEGTDNAKYYAAQAKGSAESAAGSVQVIEDNAEALQTVRDNLAGILAAPDAADRAEAASDAAGLDAERAEEAANRAQSIAQGAKGYYETPEDLRESVPEGKPGDWAIVGSTDTIWVWDKETADWKDTHQATDLSNYYTKNQADEENNKLLAQITQETDGKLAGKLGRTETAIAAEKLAAAPTINGVGFDGTEPITVEDSTKVAKTGDTMTGDLTLSGDTRAIKYQNSDLTTAPISFYKGDSSGVGIVIGGGGRTIIGGGEAATSLHSAFPANESAEELHLGGDGNVYVHTNCQTVASRKIFTFGTDGKLTAPNGFAGMPTLSLSLPVASWSASNTLSVTATGVTASNTVIVTPAPASFEAWGESMVRCTAQGANSLTFTASDKPTVALTAQVLILN